jgi:WD40 repeat protein
VTLYGHTGGIQDLAFAPDGRRLVTTASDHTVRIWEVGAVRERQPRSEQYVFRGAGFRVAVHPDGRRLASAAGRSVVFWDTTTSQDGRTFPREEAFEYRLGTLAVSPGTGDDRADFALARVNPDGTLLRSG